jgi:hypothetical protein
VASRTGMASRLAPRWVVAQWCLDCTRRRPLSRMRRRAEHVCPPLGLGRSEFPALRVESRLLIRCA